MKAEDILNDEEKLLILDDKPIEAIKAVRIRQSLTLMMAKDLIDQYRLDEGLLVRVKIKCNHCATCETCKGTGLQDVLVRPKEAEKEKGC